MIWAAIWDNQASDINFIRRDSDAPRGGYSARSYLQVLEEELPGIYQPSMIYMHDNASIYTAVIIVDWLQNHGIPKLQWPSHSPDLNPQEHAWALLKDHINEFFRHLLGQGASQRAFQEF